MTTQERHEAAKQNLQTLIRVLSERRVAMLPPIQRAIINDPARALKAGEMRVQP